MLLVLKEKNNVYLAQTLASLPHVEMSANDLISSNNLPAWRVENNPNTIVMGSACPLLLDTLRYTQKLFKGKLTLNIVVTRILPEIKRICEELKIIDHKGKLPCSVVIAQNSNVYVIEKSGLVIDVETLHAIGWYDDVIKGSLIKNKNLPAEERLNKAFQESYLTLGGYENKYFYMDTQSQKLKIV